MDSYAHRSTFRRRAGRLLSAALLASLPLSIALATFAIAPRTALAQGSSTATRTVLGKVEDKSGSPIKGAIVYLKDSHTLAVKSAVAGDDGGYHFGQLAQNTDYEIWAASDGKKSGTKNISSFDSRKEFDITLKIDK